MHQGDPINFADLARQTTLLSHRLTLFMDICGRAFTIPAGADASPGLPPPSQTPINVGAAATVGGAAAFGGPAPAFEAAAQAFGSARHLQKPRRGSY